MEESRPGPHMRVGRRSPRPASCSTEQPARGPEALSGADDQPEPFPWLSRPRRARFLLGEFPKACHGGLEMLATVPCHGDWPLKAQSRDVQLLDRSGAISEGKARNEREPQPRSNQRHPLLRSLDYQSVFQVKAESHQPGLEQLPRGGTRLSNHAELS